jgi:hypothetical protein
MRNPFPTLKPLRNQAVATMSHVSAASIKVVSVSEWATIALVAVAAVALLALGVAVIALSRTGGVV